MEKKEIKIKLNLSETTEENRNWRSLRELLFRPQEMPKSFYPMFHISRDKETGKFKTREISKLKEKAS
jgi:hypothetical protein